MDIKELAQKSGFEVLETGNESILVSDKNTGAIERFAKAIWDAATLEEREACAEIAQRYEPSERCGYVTYASDAIRARSNVQVEGAAGCLPPEAPARTQG